MAELLRDYGPSGKTVFDFGTGTGVLAMIAAKTGRERGIEPPTMTRGVSRVRGPMRSATGSTWIALNSVTPESSARRTHSTCCSPTSSEVYLSLGYRR